jgi:signal transduction histidine kinase
MNVVLTLLVFGPPVAILCFVAKSAWGSRAKPGGRYLLYLSSSIVFWLLWYAVQLNVAHRAVNRLAGRVQFLVVPFVPVFFLLFAVAYTRGYVLSRWKRIALSVVPILTVLVVWTNGFHGLMWTEFAIEQLYGLSFPDRTYQLWFHVHLGYSLCALLVGIFLFLDTITERNIVFRRQSIAIVLGTALPVFLLVLYPLGISPIRGFDVAPFALALTGICFGYAFLATDFYDMIPAIRSIGWTNMADEVESGIVVTNLETSIIEMNKTACDMFDVAYDDAMGVEANDLFGVDSLADSWDEAVELSRSNGRVYEVQSGRVTDSESQPIGYTFTVTDVTDRKRTELQLQVLNRALRHNLRNQMTIITGHTEQIIEAGERADHAGPAVEDAVVGHAEQIKAAGSELNDLGDTARRVESIIGDPSIQPIDLRVLVTDAIARVRTDFPSATITNEVTEECQVTASPHVEHAVVQMIRNAFEHNDTASTSVHVSVTTADETVTLCIRDDGSGIPDHEREILENETETALEHASGLGLWYTKWVLEASGGSLAIDVDDTGSTVRFELPADA